MQELPEWYVDITPVNPEIDWETQGDLLVQYLRDAMSEHFTLRGLRLSEDDPDPESTLLNGYRLTSEALTNELLFVFTNDGVRALIAVRSKPISNAELEPWREAFEAAVGRLQKAEPKFSWWSAIGPDCGQVNGVQRLTTGGVVGDITVNAATTSHTELVEDKLNPSLNGASVRSSFPVVIEGRSSGYNWDVAARRATIEANTVCALFSLAFDAHWRIRASPSLNEGVDKQLPILRIGADIKGVAPVLGMQENLQLPLWLAAARQTIANDEVLYTALHAHRQGLSLEELAPSLALICYVSAIEGVGAKLESLTVCDVCGAKTGANRRFGKALRTVYSASHTRDVAKVYEWRSTTAHTGKLHGGETEQGSIFLPIEVFAPRPPTMNFRYKTLWDTRKASRDVLIYHLSVGADTSETT